MSSHTTETGECCPVFDPTPWDQKSHEWKDKLFICDSIPQFLHMPLPSTMGKVIGRMWKKAEDAGAAPEGKDFLLLAYDPSPWKSILYMSVTREVPGADNVKLTGSFVSKVYDGPYSSVPKYIKDMLQYVSGLGKQVKRFYFYYTTCPKCAKKHGHNYIVSLAEV
jgi:effector-binding domain-containing protein